MTFLKNPCSSGITTVRFVLDVVHLSLRWHLVHALTGKTNLFFPLIPTVIPIGQVKQLPSLLKTKSYQLYPSSHLPFFKGASSSIPITSASIKL